MASERIKFGIDGLEVETDFDTDWLRLGGVIHVNQHEGIHRFSPQPSTSSVPHKVVNVTKRQPEGYRLVGLSREVYVPPALGPRIIEATGHAFTLDEVGRHLRRAAQEVAFENLHDPRVVNNSRLRRLEAVLDRLDLVAALNQPSVAANLWLHQRGLVAYLLLTCFDLLGQERERVDFSSWLGAGGLQGEREKALDSLGRSTDPIATTRRLYSYYNSRYGVRRGFRRFISDVLPDDARGKLMSSIAIERRVTPPLAGEEEPAFNLDDSKKADWLFELRNQYTHRAAYVPGLFESEVPLDMRDDNDWWWMGSDATANHTTGFSVRRWPKALDEAVRAGLAAYVRAI